MPETRELNEKLMQACFEYPPNLEKMQALVDAGANVNARNESGNETLLGDILFSYFEMVLSNPDSEYFEIGAAGACDILCRGKTINGRDGRYVDSIIKFFFNNGFDLQKKMMYGEREVLYAQSFFENFNCVFHGPEVIKTLAFVLSFVTCPEELYDSDDRPIYLEYESSGDLDYRLMELPRYGCCQYKVGKIIERFIKSKGWKAEFVRWEEEHLKRRS